MKEIKNVQEESSLPMNIGRCLIYRRNGNVIILNNGHAPFPASDLIKSALVFLQLLHRLFRQWIRILVGKVMRWKWWQRSARRRVVQALVLILRWRSITRDVTWHSHRWRCGQGTSVRWAGGGGNIREVESRRQVESRCRGRRGWTSSA